jgi:hypothetical protein
MGYIEVNPDVVRIKLRPCCHSITEICDDYLLECKRDVVLRLFGKDISPGFNLLPLVQIWEQRERLNKALSKPKAKKKPRGDSSLDN